MSANDHLRAPSNRDPPALPSQPAPEHALPSTSFYSVEYPGYVQDTSVPQATRHLGGERALAAAFRRTPGKQHADAILELNFRPGNPFAHPVPGDVVRTSNILLKVVKRKRRRFDAEGNVELVGEYTAEAVGVTSRTVRFRSMADFQYQPDMNDPVTQLRLAMERMDVEAIKNYRIPPEKEEYEIPAELSASDMPIDPVLRVHEADAAPPKMKSNLRLFPPPLFSRQLIPQIYNYKPNPNSVVVTTVDEETGEEKTRMINKMRWKGLGSTSISFSDVVVPEKPPASVLNSREQCSSLLQERLQKLFEERPIWTRVAILNQFSPMEAREIHNSKAMFALVSYVFSDGPWRDTQVRLGYDPRKDLDARMYQRIYFRNTANERARSSILTRGKDRTTAEQVGLRLSGERDGGRKSHIFDGLALTTDIAAFQLCDITDPMLKEMIDSQDELRETANERDGWFSTQTIENIKTVLRHKFFSLIEGHIATREECEELLIPAEGRAKPVASIHKRSKRVGKHNMAKGALPPENAAAIRLQAALQRHAKGPGAAEQVMDGV